MEEEYSRPEPKLSTFDINDWLSGGKTGRISKTEILYNDVSLFEELGEVQAEIQKLKNEQEEGSGDDESFAESPENDLRERFEYIKQKIEESKLEVRVTGLTETEVSELDKETRKKVNFPKNKDVLNSTEGTPYVFAAAATVNGGQKLDAKVWKGIENKVGPGQWKKLIRAWNFCQNGTPDIGVSF